MIMGFYRLCRRMVEVFSRVSGENRMLLLMTRWQNLWLNDWYHLVVFARAVFMDVIPAVFAEILNTVLAPELVHFFATLLAHSPPFVSTKS